MSESYVLGRQLRDLVRGLLGMPSAGESEDPGVAGAFATEDEPGAEQAPALPPSAAELLAALAEGAGTGPEMAQWLAARTRGGAIGEGTLYRPSSACASTASWRRNRRAGRCSRPPLVTG